MMNSKNSSISGSMAATNVGQIDHAQPRPIDSSVLTQQANHQSEAICDGQDLRALTCRSRNKEFSKLEPMVDERVVDIIKRLGLEGLLRTLGREIDHCLITALVERWQPKTHTFHMPLGEVTITLQDVEILLGLPVDGEAITGSTKKVWQDVCQDFLGFVPRNDETKQLDGQRIVIKRLLEQVASPLPPNAEEDQLHKYTRCYILALLGDTIFMNKSGNRVHLMWVQQLEDLRNPRRYSWGSACLAWLYRELCKASNKKASQIGGYLLLVQYWAWARFPYLCPIERGPPVGVYGPPVRGPLSLKWWWVPNKKNKPAHIFLKRYHEQIASMLPDQVVWQPYEAELENLPPCCIAGRAVWTAMVPLVCFHLIEKHTPDRVVRQFGMIQEIPHDVDTDTMLHDIDLRGKVNVDWMRKHARHIREWDNRLQRRCEAVPGDMSPQHEYFDWFKRNQIINMKNKAIPATKGAQRCGACFHLHIECTPNCFWAQYIKPGEQDKFSLLVEGTNADRFKARVLQESEDIRQIFIDNQYKIIKKKKRGQKPNVAEVKWARKRTRTCRPTGQLLLLASCAENF